MTVCPSCSKHGKLVWEEEPKPKIETRTKIARIPAKSAGKKPTKPPSETTLEIVEDYDARIRQARERLRQSHEELGKRINEKVSVLRKIETRKMMPDNMLATKLEHILKIKLIVPPSEERPKILSEKIMKLTNHELTLGDLIQLNTNKKTKEDNTEREQS